ncbi:MAG: hypothetical protein ACLUEQ_00305 [Cloacibacillus evryensis]
MVRRYRPEEKKRTFRVTYWLGVVVIAALWVLAFKSYFDRYEYLHPEITWAIPGIDTQIMGQRLLLWKNVLLSRPPARSYPLGRAPCASPERGGRACGGRGEGLPRATLSRKGRAGGAVAVLGLYSRSGRNYPAVRSAVPPGKYRRHEDRSWENNRTAQELRFIGYMPMRGDVRNR